MNRDEIPECVRSVHHGQSTGTTSDTPIHVLTQKPRDASMGCCRIAKAEYDYGFGTFFDDDSTV